jgi:hypothetical protein
MKGRNSKGYIATLLARSTPQTDFDRYRSMTSIPEAKGLAEWVNGGAPEFGKAIAALKDASVALYEADRAIMRCEPAPGLLKFWIDGELDSLRLCKNCREKWFFANRVDREFCGDKCRILFNRRTPAAKEASRIRMAASRERAKVRARLTKEAFELSGARERAEREATLAAAKRKRSTP